jgi:hypothetical protein
MSKKLFIISERNGYFIDFFESPPSSFESCDRNCPKPLQNIRRWHKKNHHWPKLVLEVR